MVVKVSNSFMGPIFEGSGKNPLGSTGGNDNINLCWGPLSHLVALRGDLEQ